MIDQNHGAAHINMRAITRAAGCAHTNVYNYFDSYSDLLYAAMLRTMEMLVLFTQKHVGTKARTYEHFSDFINAQIEFAVQHQGLFWFFWLERLPGAVPEEIKNFAQKLKNRFAELVLNCSDGKLTENEAMEISVVLHSYLHGEICKMISTRELEKSGFDETKQRIKANVDRLLKLLINNKW